VTLTRPEPRRTITPSVATSVVKPASAGVVWRPLARWLHPGAWWAWALGLAVAASRTTNPLLLGLIIAVAALVVYARRPRAPWGRTFSAFLVLGVIIIAIRIIVQMLLGIPIGTTVLFTLPTIGLPDVFAGIQIGGPVTGEEILAGAYEGLRLATILACIGAANSLASPARLLASVPAALYEAGVAVVIAVTFAPQLISDVRRVRAARRLRGRPVRGLRGITASVMPVLEGALDRSVNLAAAMDSRGYGRRASRTRVERWVSAGALLGALTFGVIGTYAVLDASVPTVVGVTVLSIAIAAGLIGMRVAGRRTARTRYRPDPWAFPEWLTATCGLLPALVFIGVGIVGSTGLATSVDPAEWPELPLLPTIAVLCAMFPAWLAPEPPDRSAS
jgi:energy-coupling factor transport system permease protein